MTRAGFLALISHWLRNPLQLFTLVVGLALATALWSGVQAINAEARASYNSAAATLDDGRFAQITTRSGAPMPQASYVTLRRSGWLVSPVVEGPFGDLRLVGIDPLTVPRGFGPSPNNEALPEWLSLTEPAFFGSLKALADVEAPEHRKFVADIPEGVVMTDIGHAQELLGLQGQISRLIVDPVQPLSQIPLALAAADLVLVQPQSTVDVANLTDSFHLNLTAFGLLAFAVGVFIVHGAIGLAFEQRRSVLRTLRALGFPLRRLIILIAAELLGFALLSGLIGVALGYVVAALLLPDVAATLRGLYGAEVSGTLQLRPSWWLSGLAISVGGTAVASTTALLGLARMPLLSAARPRALVVQARKTRQWQIGAAAALLIGAVALVMFGEGLIAGFGLLAALLIGAALALPAAIDLVLLVASRFARMVLPQWFWADTRQQIPGLSLALMALLLAMATNVGVSTMVSSFRLTFVSFLDQRLAAELYVNIENDAQSEAVARYLEPRVSTVLPIQNVTESIKGIPSVIHGPRAHATYRENWSFISGRGDAWSQIEAGTGAAINEQLARRADLWVGDEITVGGDVFQIVGIHGDYGNPIGQVLITQNQFTRLFPENPPLRFAVHMPADDVDRLSQDLVRVFDLAEANIINQAGIKALSLQVFDRTFSVTAALNVLTLAVAGFAMLMSLLTLASMRLPQLAPVWALGLTRRQIGQIELLRAILLALLTTALALPLGLALAWVLLAVVNVEAFGWRLPMYFFPMDYLRLGCLALIAATLAALWPARKLARTPPADLLKVFSNER